MFTDGFERCASQSVKICILFYLFIYISYLVTFRLQPALTISLLLENILIPIILYYCYIHQLLFKMAATNGGKTIDIRWIEKYVTELFLVYLHYHN